MQLTTRASMLMAFVMAVLAASAQATAANTTKYAKPTCLSFRKLGNGVCREEYNMHGEPVGKGSYELYEHIYTKEACADLCYKNKCTGYEYKAADEKCEVHHGRVGAYKKKDGYECYKAEWVADWEKCHEQPDYPTDPSPYELVGHGYCREAYDHYGEPYGLGDSKTACNAKNPCTEDKCREVCSEKSWCKYYEFQDIDPVYLPYGVELEEGEGRCELHRGYIGAFKPSSKAVCYKKKLA